MKTLEDEIEDLEKLDNVRLEVIEMKSNGRDALDALTVLWEKLENIRDISCIIKALCDQKSGPPSILVKKLENMTAMEILKEPHGETPILWAARSMQALAAAPDSAFSSALLTFYYQIIREIYTADSPDWQVGGARANLGGSASAYVTGECVRAILSFVKTLENTSTFVREVVDLRKRKAILVGRNNPRAWCEAETARLTQAFYTNVRGLLGNIAFKLTDQDSATSLLPVKPESVDQFIEDIPHSIAQAVSRTEKTFRGVVRSIKRFRTYEFQEAQKPQKPMKIVGQGVRQNAVQRQYQRSEAGHVLALDALQQGLDIATVAAKLFSRSPDKVDSALDKLATMFKNVATNVRTLTYPARSYLSTVLDRELAASSSETKPHWVDLAEMTFAATSYGFAAENFEDNRLVRAGIYLAEQLSERGRFRSGRPFHITSKGNSFEAIAAEILRALAQLLEHVESIPVDEVLINRMLTFFYDTMRPFRGTLEGEQLYQGWCSDTAQETAGADGWTTAVSVLALDRLTRMLDARINARVFRHFSVRSGKSFPISLSDLFYPDYGLRHKDLVPKGKDSWKREDSVALVLERMRSHVLGQRERSESSLYSLILHGPPGTGKTTLVEALAKSANVPFVEVTPSDIVSSGADVVERRARAVFKALSLLTRVVILFDEFDPVLKRRKYDNRENTVFSFVTPGMLPKLKHLHQKAKDRNVAYVLVTNLIGILDDAAIRTGRFDYKLGIYPPDPLSRQGRLIDEVSASVDSIWPSDLQERMFKVIQNTSGGQMDNLAKPGWFSRPRNKKPIESTPFGYLSGLGEFEKIDWPDAAKKPNPLEKDFETALTEPFQAAEREYRQLAWISEWEKLIREDKTITNELAGPPTETPQVEFIKRHPKR